MENAAFYIIMIVTLPVVLVSVVTALNAKKTNAMWRAKREARAAAKAAAQ